MRLRLALFGLILLLLPWLGWRHLDAMRAFLLDGQAQAQLLHARALATLAAAHPAAFAAADSVTGSAATGPEPPSVLRYAYPMAEFPTLDGYADDWAALIGRATQAGGAALSFRWVAATWRGQLYLLVQVDDPQRTYREPADPRLDTSDHLRLRLDGADGQRRLSICSDGPGRARVEAIGRDWRYPLYGAGRLPVEAWWQETGAGYQVEVRLPRSWVASFRIAAVDVDRVDELGRRVVESMAWSPARRPGEGQRDYHLVSRSADLQALLAHDWQLAETVLVIDRQGWVRAGSDGAGDLDRVDPAGLDGRLDGPPATWLASAALSGGRPVAQLNALYPVFNQGKRLGAVLLRRPLEALLAAQWRAFRDIGAATLAALSALVLGLLLFAGRIAWRIRRLGRETARAIDPDGRVCAAQLRVEVGSKDEFGDLSRRISAVLRRLQRYTGFLESVPRTLRHEINNPLNTISTSVQNLAASRPDLAENRYLRAAERGIVRLETIVKALTEAAGLEQALRGERLARFDLAELAAAYADSLAALHPNRRVEYRGPQRGIWVDGSDIRIEQLLDKLVDNAVDFSPEGGWIGVGLARHGGGCRLTVANDGPRLPAAIAGQRFDSLLSVRAGEQPGPHLGMGLYVARLIAEQHRGVLSVANRETVGGVIATVTLPTTEKRL